MRRSSRQAAGDTRCAPLPALPDDPFDASRLLLRSDPASAQELFARLPEPTQLQVLDATTDPRDRESLYYLVPDCQPLVRATRVESLLEMVGTVFGTGLACGILSAVSAEQFSDMFERTAWSGGVADREAVSMWLAELSALDPEELSVLLCGLDVEVLGELFRGQVDVPIHVKGMVVASGLVDLEQVEFQTEEVRLMGELVWAADPDLFRQTLRFLFVQDEDFAADDDEVDDDDHQPGTSEDPGTDLDNDSVDVLLPPATKRKP